MAIGDVTTWRRVVELPDLLAAAAVVLREAEAAPEREVAAITRLRATWDEALVRVALHLVKARERAREKFSEADRMACDRQGVEQASSERVAGWKAERFGRVGASQIWDLCSGLGGDTMALASRGGTTAVDLSDVRAWMAAFNAGLRPANHRCQSRVEDVTALDERTVTSDSVVHIDPARRIEASSASRSLTPLHVPSLDQCERLARLAAGAALKLGPGLDPALLPPDAGLEWISEGGTLVQLVAWFGSLRDASELAPGERMASKISGGGTDTVGISRRGLPTEVPLRADSRFGRFLFVPDPAIERSRLMGSLAGELGLAEPAAGLGVLTGNDPVVTPWLDSYELLEQVKPDERRVADSIRSLWPEATARGALDIRVRTRGGAADADAWTRSLRRRLGLRATPGGGPPTRVDVFLLRVGTTRQAIVARSETDPPAISG